MVREIKNYMKINDITIPELSNKTGVTKRFIQDISSGAIENGNSQYKKDSQICKKYCEIIIREIGEDNLIPDQITKEDVIDTDKISVDELKKLIDKYNNKLEKIKKESYKLNIIRNSNSKPLKKEAEYEILLEGLENSIKNIGKKELIQVNHSFNKSDNDIIVSVADWHIGQQCKSEWGFYNYDTAVKRITQYYNEIIKIKDTHNIENCHVVCLGDLIHGDIHAIFDRSNEFTLNMQISNTINLLEEFLLKLSEHFKNVYVYGVVGNHSRRKTSKDDADINDYMDDQIINLTSKILSHVGNINFTPHIHPTKAYFKVKNLNVLAVHGDKINVTNQNGVYKLVTQAMAINKKVDIIISGHLHHAATNEYNNIKTIQVGCLPGSGDDYTIDKGIAGEPSQTVLVVNENGILCNYTIKLD